MDSSTSRSPHTDGNKRLAWLLAVNRMHAGDGDQNRSDFADRLRALDVRADSSRISRWESGMDALPPRLVRSYERALELAPHSLDVVRRHLARTGELHTRAGQRADDTAEDPGLNRILAGLDGGTMDGATWLDLTDGLASYEKVFLPDPVWRSLADRLTGEITRSAGMAFARRYEAGAALMGNPNARPHLNRSVGRFTLKPGAQLVAPTLTLLGEHPDNGVADLVLRMLTSENDRLRGAAEITTARLVAAGEVAPDAKEIEVHVGYSVHTTEGLPHAAVTELASRMPGECFERITAAARTPRLRQWLHRVRDTCETVDGEQARTVSDHLAAVGETSLLAAPGDPDPMLRSLVREALFHAHRERRVEATLLLSASPYATGIVAAALAETSQRDEATAGACWSFVARLAAYADPAALCAAVRTETRPGLRHRAISCLTGSVAAADDTIVGELSRIAADPDGGADARSALMVLGLRGHGDQMVAAAANTPPEVIAWWQQVGSLIQEG